MIYIALSLFYRIVKMIYSFQAAPDFLTKNLEPPNASRDVSRLQVGEVFRLYPSYRLRGHS